MNISVMGCGRWGSFIAWYLNRIGHNVVLWGLEGCEAMKPLKENHKNKTIEIDDSITLTSDLDFAVDHAEVIVISISSQAMRNFMGNLSSKAINKKPIILCMKGIEETTGKRLTQVVKDFVDNDVAIWVGPGHVQDFTRGIPNCMVIDSTSQELKEKLIKSFSSDLIRFYYGADLIGNEIGAAAKNVIGIAAGMLDGLGYESLKGSLMSRGTREISRLIKALGGNELSAYGLCHLGDYQATLFSPHSHNRKFGEMLINGESYTELAEGVSTTRALMKLSKEYNVDLPICKAVEEIINEKRDPKEVLSNLFMRSIKKEF